jgi:hypothetical protein
MIRVLKIDEGKKKHEEKKAFIATAQNTRGAFQAGAVHRLVLAFLRVGNFLTGRCPGGGAACGDGVPIVKIALPLLPGVWV